MAKKEETGGNRKQIDSLTKAQEKFCQICANTTSIGEISRGEAYAQAFQGVTCEKSGRQGAFRLMSMPKIRKRIAEIRRENALKNPADEARIIAELQKIAFANIADYVRWDANGNVEAIPLEDLSDDQKAAIRELLGRDGWKGRRVVLYDKIAALEKLAKYLGLFTEKVDVTSGGQPIAALTDDERLARISEIFERARTRRDGSGDSGPSEE